MTSLGPYLTFRECHGFVTPCGCNLRAPAGTGTGLNFMTLVQPVPVRRDSGARISHVTTVGLPEFQSIIHHTLSASHAPSVPLPSPEGCGPKRTWSTVVGWNEGIKGYHQGGPRQWEARFVRHTIPSFITTTDDGSPKTTRIGQQAHANVLNDTKVQRAHRQRVK
jgi:hypothetical protein